MSDATYEPVVFQNSLGEEISNDPIWHAKRTLEQAGITLPAEQQSVAANAAAAARNDEDDDLDGDEDEKPEDYKKFDGPALKKIAKDRGIDISGFGKVGELRAALIQADVDKAAQDEVDAANSGADTGKTGA